MIHLYALLKIELAFMKRNKISWILGVGMPLMIFLLLSSIFTFDSEQEQIYAIRQMMISMAVFSSVSFTIFTFPVSLLNDKQSQWLQRLKYSPVRLLTYYIARGIRLIINFSIASFIILFVGIVFKHVSLTMTEVFMIWLLIVIGNSCMLAMASLLTIIKSSETLFLVSNMTYMLLGILGGLWFPVTTFPHWLQSISHLIPTYQLAKVIRDYLSSHHINFTSIISLLMYAVISIIIVYGIKRWGGLDA